MAVTSSTTSVAFFANLFSPIMPIRAFGIFAGIIVPVNFFLVVMVFPGAVIFYEKYIEGRFSKMCSRDSKTKNSDVLDNEDEVSKFEKFFTNTWNDSVYKARYVIIFVFLCWLVFSGITASKMESLTEEESFVDEWNPLMRPFTIQKKEFSKRDGQLSSVDFFFGVVDIDRTGDSLWDPTFVGKPIFDPLFNIASKDN